MILILKSQEKSHDFFKFNLTERNRKRKKTGFPNEIPKKLKKKITK